MMLIATCSVFAWILTYENLPTHAGRELLQPDPEQMGVPAASSTCFLLIVGMFVDMTPALIMLVPMLMPLAQKFGIDLVHLGLIMVINLAFGLTTPPVGTALFVALKVGASCRWRRSSRRCCRCSPACGRAAVRDLCARGLHVAAAQLRAGQIGLVSENRSWPKLNPHGSAERRIASAVAHVR